MGAADGHRARRRRGRPAAGRGPPLQRSTTSPTAATSCSRSAATGRCSAACAWPRRSACPCSAPTSAASAISPRSTASTWPRDSRRSPPGPTPSRSASCCARVGSGRLAPSTWPSTTSSSAASRAAARPCSRSHVDGQLLVRYASDGVIAATPAGSTAYSYAAGGPIVSPQTRAMIVTPDAPHGLFNRAVVLGAEEQPGRRGPRQQRPGGGRGRRPAAGGGRPGLDLDITPNPWPALVVRLGSAGFAERARRKLGITDPAALANYDFAGHER